MNPLDSPSISSPSLDLGVSLPGLINDVPEKLVEIESQSQLLVTEETCRVGEIVLTSKIFSAVQLAFIVKALIVDKEVSDYLNKVKWITTKPGGVE